MDSAAQGAKIQEVLGATSAAVAVTFASEPPAGVPHVSRVAAAGCAYWKAAADGESFYTTASDHYNCAVGAMTHGVQLPPERESELTSVVGTLLDLDYLRKEELPNIPHLEQPFGVAVYAPLAATPCDPDVVIIRGNAKQIMLAWEAALAAGLSAGGATMGRPACSMIPATIQSGSVWTSLGCIGNRVYTGLKDDELYFTIPGNQLDAFVSKLEVVANANQVLTGYHREREQTLYAGATNA
jgi:uncharacterized protein (DUF169 family)